MSPVAEDIIVEPTLRERLIDTREAIYKHAGTDPMYGESVDLEAAHVAVAAINRLLGELAEQAVKPRPGEGFPKERAKRA